MGIRRILMTMPEAVYVDTVEEKRIVAIRPKPAFRPLLEIATTRRTLGWCRGQLSAERFQAER